ncbi:MAG: glycosyltransferase [Clostridia bacterium]|nr:glycosyltransferase [Clostridia bacterium]
MADLVSVIVPIYKVEAYLKKCVDSILAQTYPALEVILVDDGSPDGCGAICDEYAGQDARVRVIHQENGGVSKARNAGLDAAEGRYVMFTDSDDWIEPDMVATLIEGITAYGADIVTVNLRSFDASGDLKERVMDMRDDVLEFPQPDYLKLLQLHGTQISIFPFNSLYRRELIEKLALRFLPMQQVHSEDQLFNWCYYAAVRKAVYIDKPLYVYRVGVNTLSRSEMPAEILNRRVTLVCVLEAFLKKHLSAMPPRVFFDSLTWLYFISGCDAVHKSERILAGIGMIAEKKERRRFRKTLWDILCGQAGREYIRQTNMDRHARLYFRAMLVLMLLGKNDRPVRTYLSGEG